MRRISRFFILILCVVMLTTVVHAESYAGQVETRAVVSSNGTATVTLTAKINLDSPADNLTFPLPRDAKNVTVNNTSVRTYPSPSDGNVILADLSSLDGIVGEYYLNFSYTQSDVLETVETKVDNKVENKLYLKLPLLCGFEFPVKSMTFYVTLPGEISYKPTYTSGFMQTNIDSVVSSEVIGTMVTGSITQTLQDRETLTLNLQVTEQMFPGKLIIAREGNPEVVPMSVCAALALVYWLLLMRCPPLLRQRRTTPLEGVTAGEIGSHLTAAGTDLTMMVFSWAQLGYLKILPDRYGRVLLQKRMDMGNERDAFENRCFQWLFSKDDIVDGTGTYYAKLCGKVSQTISGVQEMYRRRAGNIKLFRVLACGVNLFGGICLAMNMVNNTVLRTLLSILLAIVGVVTGWIIQSAMYRLHIRGKTVQYLSGICILLWVVLGILAGQWLIALCCILAQMLAGVAAAYGGRRSDLGYYQASQILGLRHYLKTIPRQQLEEIMENHPDYFFEMLPYAIAMGVDTQFARQFGNMRLPQCSYITARYNPNRSAAEWALLMRKTADRLDQRQRRMQLEAFLPVSIRLGGPNQRRNTRGRQRRPRRR